MQQESYNVQKEVQLLSALGEYVDVSLNNISYTRNNLDQIVTLSLSIRVDYNNYQKIISESLFNIFPEIGISSKFDDFDDAPVEINLQLKQSVVEKLNSFSIDLENLCVLLLKDKCKNLDKQYLSFTENWLAISFKQSVDLPPELQGEGSLKQGYQTLWAKQDFVFQKLHQTNKSNEAIIIDFLESKQWQYQKSNQNIFSLSFSQQNEKWTFLIAIPPENNNICCYSIYPENIPENQRGDFAIFITGINYELEFGNFELDFDDGELRFRTSLPITQNIDITTLDIMIQVNIMEMTKYLPEFRRLRSEL